MPGKKRSRRRDPVVEAQLDARHTQVQAEVDAAYDAAAAALGFTRRAFVYWMATAYDMAVDDIADGAAGDRAAHLGRLLGHVEANLEALVNFPSAEGSVFDAVSHDRDDPECPDG